MTDLQAYLASAPTRTVRGEVRRKIQAPITCADGFTLSVQASKTHYCSPEDDTGPWTQVEVGFPSAEEPLLMPYAEDPEEPTRTVYGYVPIEIVVAVIDSHGGFITTKEEN